MDNAPLSTGQEGKSLHKIDQEIEETVDQLSCNNGVHDLHVVVADPLAQGSTCLVQILATLMLMTIEKRRREITGLEQSLED